MGSITININIPAELGAIAAPPAPQIPAVTPGAVEQVVLALRDEIAVLKGSRDNALQDFTEAMEHLKEQRLLIDQRDETLGAIAALIGAEPPFEALPEALAAYLANLAATPSPEFTVGSPVWVKIPAGGVGMGVVKAHEADGRYSVSYYGASPDYSSGTVLVGADALGPRESAEEAATPTRTRRGRKPKAAEQMPEARQVELPEQEPVPEKEPEPEAEAFADPDEPKEVEASEAQEASEAPVVVSMINNGQALDLKLDPVEMPEGVDAVEYAAWARAQIVRGVTEGVSPMQFKRLTEAGLIVREQPGRAQQHETPIPNPMAPREVQEATKAIAAFNVLPLPEDLAKGVQVLALLESGRIAVGTVEAVTENFWNDGKSAVVRVGSVSHDVETERLRARRVAYKAPGGEIYPVSIIGTDGIANGRVDVLFESTSTERYGVPIAELVDLPQPAEVAS